MGSGSSTVSREDRELDLQKPNNGERNHDEVKLDFKVDFILGKGGYSTVYHGINMHTQHEVAIKQLNLKKLMNQSDGNEDLKLNSIKTIFTELNAFKRIQQQNSFSKDFIATLHSASYSKSSCYFVMSCCEGGDLRRYLRQNGPLHEEAVVYVVGCLGSALHFLHSQGVIHRDVKPENIGLDLRGRPYLMDFGISVISTTDNPLPICYTSSGTREYLAPEVLAPSNCHSYQSDFWSLGVMAHEMLLGHRPFSSHNYIDAVKFVANEYDWMWKKLKNTDQTMISPHLDFQYLHRCCAYDDDRILPFPDVASKLQLDENGNPPPPLIVSLPEIYQPNSQSPSKSSPTSHRQISDDCRKLITGLLDVRIPHRLGNIPRFSDFRDHDCFRRHRYHPLSALVISESPLSPIRIDIPESLNQSFHLQCDHNHQSSSPRRTWDPILFSLPQDIKQQLWNFSYDASHGENNGGCSASQTFSSATISSKY